MEANSKMLSLINLIDPELPCEYPEGLQEILEQNWLISDCGALLLSSTGAHAVSWPCSAEDVAQREYEVNDVKIPDLDFDFNDENFLRDVTARAISFARASLLRAQGIDGSATLTSVISVAVDDEFNQSGATVKFFTRRGNYPDWYEDLNRFKMEAIMLIDMADVGNEDD